MYIVSGKKSGRELPTEITENDRPENKTEDIIPGEKPLARPERTALPERAEVTGGELGSVPYSGRLAAHALPVRPDRPFAPDILRERRNARRPYAAESGRFRRHVRSGGSTVRKTDRRAAVLYAMIALFAIGFAAGCAVWSTPEARAQCAGLTGGYAHFAQSCGFAEGFWAGLRQQLPLMLALAACSLFVAGCAGCAVLLFVRGMGSAMALCTLFADGVSAYAICAAAYIAACTAVLAMTARDAADMSLGLVERPTAGQWVRCAARLALYALLLAAAAAAHSAVLYLLRG